MKTHLLLCMEDGKRIRSKMYLLYSSNLVTETESYHCIIALLHVAVAPYNWWWDEWSNSNSIRCCLWKPSQSHIYIYIYAAAGVCTLWPWEIWEAKKEMALRWWKSKANPTAQTSALCYFVCLKMLFCVVCVFCI